MQNHILKAVNQTKSSIGEISFNPWPALISYALVVILSLYLYSVVNFRINSQATEPSFSGAHGHLGDIWISVTPTDEGLKVVTDEKSLLSINFKSDPESKILYDYLYLRLQKLSFSAGLEKRTFLDSTFLTLSLDRSLRFYQLAPLIKIIASLGISNYSLEYINTHE